MSEKTLSVIVPARNEMFLGKTIESIVTSIRGETDVIAVLDGYWPEPPIVDHPRVTLVHYTDSIGQRAACNVAVKLSKAKYIAKVDAHCSFDEGFDVKMMEVMKDNWTMVPVMRNLHAFDWVCKCGGDRRYQGPTPSTVVPPVPCKACGGLDFVRDVVWIAKTNPQSTAYCFDPEPHFQYFRDWKKRPESRGDLTETMSLQGSFFMVTREKYWELNLCDEEFGSWGSQGIEVAVKTWLSGGKVMVNHKTWYAHMFRTQGGDFGFPWPASGRQIQAAKKKAKNIFFNNQWEKQKYPLHWLVEKFWPVPGWTDADLAALKANKLAMELSTSQPVPIEAPEEIVDSGAPNEASTPLRKGIVYYTDNRIEPKLMRQCQDTLKASGLPIVSVSLKPIDFGKNIVFPLFERSYLTMFKQILAGIEALDVDIIFLCEHDVLYTPEHFKFTPPRDDVYYYNMSNWQIRQTDGFALYWECKKVANCVAYKSLLLAHYRERVRRVELEGYSNRIGFEPGTHNRPERIDNFKSEGFRTEIPTLDFRHKYNLTASRWSPDKFRNKPKNWAESHVNELPGWSELDYAP